MKDMNMVIWAVFMLFAISYLCVSTIADAISNSISDIKCKQCKKRRRETNEIN